MRVMHSYHTPQETFWAGEFGSEYAQRNAADNNIAKNLVLFSRILARTHAIASYLELGANQGVNIRALQQLLPQAQATAVEINADAFQILKQLPNLTAYHQSILNFTPPEIYDLTFTKGVLIHIAPEYLPQVYQTLYKASRRYIVIVEYYNPTPVQVNYRGHQERLFKRDFAGELLDLYPDLRLLDYGFAYHRDPIAAHDDTTWFVLEKTGS